MRRYIIRGISILLLISIALSIITVFATNSENNNGNDENDNSSSILGKLKELIDTIVNLPKVIVEEIINKMSTEFRKAIIGSVFFYLDHITNYVREKIESDDVIFMQNDLNNIINQILNVTKPLAYSLIALFFVLNMLKSSVYFEVMTLEGFLKPILMFFVGKFATDSSYLVLKTISNLNTALAEKIINMGRLNETALYNAVNQNSNVQDVVLGFFQYLVFGFLGLILLLLFLGIGILLVVRQLEMATMVCVSPIFFATLCGGFTDVFKSFIKNYIAITMQTTVMAIGIVFFNKLAAEFATANSLTQIATFFGTIFTLFAIATFCLKTPSFIRQTLGGGGGVSLSSIMSTFTL